jgi:hypothetical protein
VRGREELLGLLDLGGDMEKGLFGVDEEGGEVNGCEGVLWLRGEVKGCLGGLLGLCEGEGVWSEPGLLEARGLGMERRRFRKESLLVATFGGPSLEGRISESLVAKSLLVLVVEVVVGVVVVEVVVAEVEVAVVDVKVGTVGGGGGLGLSLGV